MRRTISIIPLFLMINILHAQFLPGGVVATEVFTNGLSIGGALRTIDLDGDGDIDVVASTNEEIIWWSNVDGEGGFGAGDTIIQGANDGRRFDLADLDADGDADLVLYEFYGGPHLRWYPNNGDGTFAPPVPIASLSGIWIALADPVKALITEDVNGDGLQDVLITVPNRVKIYLNQGSGFAPGLEVQYSTSDADHLLLAGDMDLDGDTDVLAGASNDLYLLTNTDGIGSQWEVSIALEGFGTINENMRLLDVDGDGDNDVVDVRNAVKWAEVVVNDGMASFIPHMIQPEPPTYGSGTVGTIGCAQQMAMIYVEWPFQDPPELAVFDTGTGEFGIEAPLSGLPMSRALHLADLNGDGMNDLLLANGDDHVIHWWQGETAWGGPIEFEPFDTLCYDGGSYLLDHAMPEGGVWTGAGVAGNTFTPTTPGASTLFYKVYDSLSNCLYSDAQELVVVGPPEIELVSGNIGAQCDTAPLVFTATPPGGTWAGAGVDANGVVDRSPEARPIEWAVVAYTLNTVNNGSCYAISELINAPDIQHLDLGQDTTVCASAAPLQLYYGPPSLLGGYIDLNGFDSVQQVDQITIIGTFDPAAHLPGEYLITGVAGTPATCPGHDTLVITVEADPLVTIYFPDTLFTWMAQPFELVAYPEGGIFTLDGNEEPILSFDPSIAGTGEFTMHYTWTDPNTGCTGTDEHLVLVLATVGVHGVDPTVSNIQVYPNPTERFLKVAARQDVAIDLIIVSDAAGRSVHRADHLRSPAILDLAHLEAGNYFLTCFIGGSSTRMPFIIH